MNLNRIVISSIILLLGSCAPSYQFHCPTSNEIALNYFNSGIKLCKMGYTDHAISQFVNSLNHDSTLCDAYDNLALIAREAEKFGTALNLLQKSLEINPNNTLALQNSGFYSNVLGRHSEAIEYFKRLVILQPKNPEAYFGMGLAFLELGNLEGALKNTKRSFELYDEKNLIIKENMYTVLGTIYYKMRNYDQAVEYLKKAQPLLKLNPYADLYLGLCYYYMDPSDKEEAKDLLKSVPQFREMIPEEVIDDLGL